MKTMPFKEIRKNLTNIANDVQYSKEFFIFTKNNKPSVGVVPAEMLLLLAKVFKLSKTDSNLAKLTNEYGLYLTTEEFKFIESHLQNPPKPSVQMKKIIRAAKNKFPKNNAII
jgi:hypothetical protein